MTKTHKRLPDPGVKQILIPLRYAGDEQTREFYRALNVARRQFAYAELAESAHDARMWRASAWHWLESARNLRRAFGERLAFRRRGVAGVRKLKGIAE